MPITNADRRRVMLTAWELAREGRQLREARSFADCLRWAWVQVKRELAKAAFATMRVVRLSPSLINSPIARTLNGRPGGAHRDFKAAYVTARIGA
jgi:hypothetical protein